jgi:hypothetical protein
VQQGRAFFGAGIALYNQEEYDVAVDALQKVGMPLHPSLCDHVF